MHRDLQKIITSVQVDAALRLRQDTHENPDLQMLTD